MEIKSIEEFELYALLYVASLDMRISKAEMKIIGKKFSGEMFQEVTEMFEEENDSARLDTILQASAVYLQTDEQKTNFLKDLRHLAEADDFAPIEIASLSMLGKLIGVKA